MNKNIERLYQKSFAMPYLFELHSLFYELSMHISFEINKVTPVVYLKIFKFRRIESIISKLHKLQSPNFSGTILTHCIS